MSFGLRGNHKYHLVYFLVFISRFPNYLIATDSLPTGLLVVVNLPTEHGEGIKK